MRSWFPFCRPCIIVVYQIEIAIRKFHHAIFDNFLGRKRLKFQLRTIISILHHFEYHILFGVWSKTCSFIFERGEEDVCSFEAI